MAAARAPAGHIDLTGDRPVVRGTDIKVSQIASEYEHLEMSPDEIVQAHPHLSLGNVHAALAYFYDHRDEIRRDWQETEVLVSMLRKEFPSRLTRKARS